MRTSTSYRLIAGLVLVGVIFFAELYLSWGFFLYLIVPGILYTIPDQKKQVALGLIISVCIVAGYVWWTRETEVTPAELGNRVLLLSMVWLVIFFSTRIRKFSAGDKRKSEIFDSLQHEKEAAVTRLSLIERELVAANAEKRVVEDELQKGKRLHDTLVQHYPDGVICVLNREMKYVFANGRGLEAFGLTPAELTGNHAAIGSGDELTRAFNGENISFETTIHHESYTVNAIPIPDVRNEINEILIIIRNITDRKKLENNLIKAIAKEKELSALKTQFVTMASHKFRTPLSTILSSVFLLENNIDADDQERKSYFDKIKRSVHHLTDLLNDFLSLGKLEEGKVKVAFSETNIKSFFQDFLQEIISLKKTKQKILFTYEGMDCTVMTDQLLIKNILMSLMTNAIEYSSQEAEIELAVELKKDNLNIRVSDQGIGIPEEEQHQIFKRFYRGHNTSNVEGTGLGLNIAKKYIRLLKGTIEFKSQLNKGTTFITNIPVVTLDILETQA